MTKEAMAPAFGAGSQIGQGLGTMIGGTDSGMPDSAGEAGAAAAVRGHAVSVPGGAEELMPAVWKAKFSMDKLDRFAA